MSANNLNPQQFDNVVVGPWPQSGALPVRQREYKGFPDVARMPIEQRHDWIRKNVPGVAMKEQLEEAKRNSAMRRHPSNRNRNN